MRVKLNSSMESVKKLCQNQLELCQRLVSSYPKVELLEKARSSVQTSLEIVSRAQDKAELLGDSKTFKIVLSEFTQSCLDSSYHEECQLVDKEFPDNCAREQITQIVETLARPLTLCQLLECEVGQLGCEIIECVHWRVGALLYMYCHMVLTVEERRKDISVEHFKEVLCLGVGHLNLMLLTRAPLKEDDYVTHDTTVPTLLKKGIFSDIHMLSLMYAGEMCHWYWEIGPTHPQSNPSHTDDPQTTQEQMSTSPDDTGEQQQSDIAHRNESSSKPDYKLDTPLWCVMELTQGVDFARQWRDNFNPQKYGVEFLSKYVDVARGPLKDQSWNYTKAIQFLVSLRKSI